MAPGAHREARLPDLRRVRRAFAASTSFVLALRASERSTWTPLPAPASQWQLPGQASPAEAP